jgi:hypothetical protein
MLIDKKLEDLTQQEVSRIHLSGSEWFLVDKTIKSTLSFIHRSISQTFGHPDHKHLLPIMGLLAILDQLGSCYNNIKKEKIDDNNNIRRCLYFFGNMPKDDEYNKIIVALRNSLFHNVSLCSKDPHNQNNYYFRYFEDNTENAPLYRTAHQPWNGNFKTLDITNNETLINIIALQKKVTLCIETAYELNEENKLKIRLPHGKDELISSYLMWIVKN